MNTPFLTRSRGNAVRPNQAFDTQMHLSRDVTTNIQRRIMEWHLNAGVTPFLSATVDQVIGWQHHTLLNAATYWVSETMTDYLLDAASTAPDQPLYETDLPALDGYMTFERPVLTRDARDDWVNVRSVMWQHTDGPSPGDNRPGIIITLWSDWECPGDTGAILASKDFDRIRAELNRQLHRPALTLYHISAWPFGQMLGDEDIADRPCDGMALTMPGGETANYTADEISDARSSQLAFIGFLSTTWTLMDQRITDVDSWAPANRGDRKTVARSARRRAEPPDIVTVNLRRPRRPPTEDGGDGLAVEHDHRWIRSAHWRWQWYPSYRGPCTHCRVDNGRPCMREDGEHRRIWIDEQVCGPEDKPLKPRSNVVHKLVR